MSQPAEAVRQAVLYEKPRDFPTRWVVREWAVLPGLVMPGVLAYLFDSQEDAEDFVEQRWPELVKLAPSPGDDPTIRAVWV